ncbi:MAG: ATP-binding cassette domain-containing protein [Methanosarcinaceae archaeon]|nr:ATP-binding cassette domain-containing protein [Methanosarcinaceae archaeon]
MTAIEVTHVIKSYNNTEVIRDISFSVKKGEIFGILGPNGAGKTTMLRMLLNHIKPDSGTIKIFGEPIKLKAKDKVGYLPEERGLYQKSRVLEILVYFGMLKGMSKIDAHDKAEKLLRTIELYDVKNKRVEELSKGMQQKVQFIGTILHDPDIIIVDEPFSGLDPVNTRLLKRVMLEQKKAGKAIVLSTHMMEQAAEMCDQLLMINKGKIVMYGKLDEIMDKYYKNSIIIEPEYIDDESISLIGVSKTISRLRDIAGVVDIKQRKREIELFLDDETDENAVLREIIDIIKIKRFEHSVPSLNDIFISIVEEGTE